MTMVVFAVLLCVHLFKFRLSGRKACEMKTQTSQVPESIISWPQEPVFVPRVGHTFCHHRKPVRILPAVFACSETGQNRRRKSHQAIRLTEQTNEFLPQQAAKWRKTPAQQWGFRGRRASDGEIVGCEMKQNNTPNGNCRRPVVRPTIRL